MSSISSTDRCRTVVVTGVPGILPNKQMKDKLTIHFQRARSHGGDVEEVQYPTHLEGVAFITFDKQQDADRVVEYSQVLKDRELTGEYPLTVYKYNPEVAFYAFAEVDMSRFPDHSSLIAKLSSKYRTLRIQPFPNKAGFITAEGPFAALQELRTDLLNRAQDLRDLRPSPDKPKQITELKDNRLEGTDRVSFWLDAHIYTYIQSMKRDEWDRFVGRYNVTTEAVSTGEVTHVKLSSKSGDKSAVTAAQADLQKLASELQSTLRTHHIDCRSTNMGSMKKLLEACERAQKIHTSVCYVPKDSCIEVIGPSFSNHYFCEFVESLTEVAKYDPKI